MGGQAADGQPAPVLIRGHSLLPNGGDARGRKSHAGRSVSAASRWGWNCVWMKHFSHWPSFQTSPASCLLFNWIAFPLPTLPVSTLRDPSCFNSRNGYRAFFICPWAPEWHKALSLPGAPGGSATGRCWASFYSQRLKDGSCTSPAISCLAWPWGEGGLSPLVWEKQQCVQLAPPGTCF